jgi:hypothetical protein
MANVLVRSQVTCFALSGVCIFLKCWRIRFTSGLGMHSGGARKNKSMDSILLY